MNNISESPEVLCNDQPKVCDDARPEEAVNSTNNQPESVKSEIKSCCNNYKEPKALKLLTRRSQMVNSKDAKKPKVGFGWNISTRISAKEKDGPMKPLPGTKMEFQNVKARVECWSDKKETRKFQRSITECHMILN